MGKNGNTKTTASMYPFGLNLAVIGRLFSGNESFQIINVSSPWINEDEFEGSPLLYQVFCVENIEQKESVLTGIIASGPFEGIPVNITLKEKG